MFIAFAFIVCVSIICLTIVVSVAIPIVYKYLRGRRDISLETRVFKLELNAK